MDQNNRKREEIWAVRDVSFEVKHGEVVGLIGRNAVARSTLLTMLARHQGYRKAAHRFVDASAGSSKSALAFTASGSRK